MAKERASDGVRRAAQGIATAIVWLSLLWAEPLAAEDLASRLAAPPAGVSPRALVVRLAFAADVDLDLYVTDPQRETAYFANTPTRLGGRLERDVRCDSSGARVETFVLDPAPPGPYRVGIDFPERCGSGRGESPWALRIDAPNLRRDLAGDATPGRFDAIVLEFALEAGASD